MPKNLLATLATIRPKPRAINHCLRFPGRSDRAISSALRAHSHGGRNAEDFALQRNRASDRNVDSATFREAIPGDHQCKFLIHDRDSIFSPSLDQELEGFGLRVLRTPVRSPQANAYCERLVGTIRRECLDFLIPLNESHLRVLLKEWVRHYNEGRPHMSLGPGIPEHNDINKEAAILRLRKRARRRSRE
jgi:transposase InsO family protein